MYAAHPSSAIRPYVLTRPMNIAGGVDLVMSSPIRECAPISIWYNFTETGVQLPPDTTLPAAGALSFHTPDEAKDQWMILSPPMGTGVFAWDSPMTAGQKFVLRGVAGYEDIITVSNNGNGCSRQGPPATTTFEHGTLALPMFTSFLSASYPATTISTAGFLCVSEWSRRLFLCLLTSRSTGT